MAMTASQLIQTANGICPVKSSFDYAKYAQARAERLNRVHGGLEGYECKRCLNRGYIMRVRAGGELASVECKCMAARRSINRLKRSGLENMICQNTFERFETLEKWQAEAKIKAQEFAKNPCGRWFFASGNPGSGKTHLCVAACREIMLKGIEVRYMLWRTDSSRAKATVNDAEEYAKIVDPLKAVPVLYIDDFFKTGREERPTVGDINLAFEILNARYNDPKLVTLISTERSFSELLEIDEALGSRIYERAKNTNISLKGTDKNWRLR